MYLEGVGDKRDIIKATRYLNMACTSGNTYGCEIIKEISEKKYTIKTTEVKIPKQEIKKQVVPVNNLKQKYVEKKAEKKTVTQTSQQEFQKWKKADFTTNDIEFYLSKNISLGEAQKWKNAYFSAKNAYYYIKNNIPINEAKSRINKKH